MKRPSAARVLLVLSLVQCWAITGLMTSGMQVLPHRAGLARIAPVEVFLQPMPWAIYSLLYVVALGAFLLRRREQAAGFAILFMLAIQVGLEMSVRRIFMPHLEAMLSGGLLASWLLTRAWGARQGHDEQAQDHLGHEVAAGTFGAMMMLAAGSKLHLSGMGWFSGAAHCATMFEHDLLNPGLPGSGMRQTMMTQLWMCSLGAFFALGVEGVGFVMVWPRWRKAYAVSVVLLFLSLAVFYGIMEVSWPLMACAFAWSHLGDVRPREQGAVSPAP